MSWFDDDTVYTRKEYLERDFERFCQEFDARTDRYNNIMAEERRKKTAKAKKEQERAAKLNQSNTIYPFKSAPLKFWETMPEDMFADYIPPEEPY